MVKSTKAILSILAIFASILSISKEAAAEDTRTFVLVHGAWHGAWAWETIEPVLEARGHKAVAVDLPGHGLDMTPLSDITLSTYAEKVAAVIDQLDGKVVLVAHSLGGGTATLVGELRSENLDSIVYVAAFMPRNGETLLDLALSDSEAQVFPNLVLPEDQTFSFFKRDGAIHVFYHDVAEEVAKNAVLRLNWQPIAPYVQPMTITDERFGSVKRIYLKTLKDRAVTPEFQQRMIDAMPPSEVIELDTGHSPFLVDPEAFVETLIQATEN